MLKLALDAFLALRRALGYSCQREGQRLASFVAFAEPRGDTHVRTATAIAWARATASLSEPGRRLKLVARFARHLHAEDPRHEIPPDDLFPCTRQRPTPYILAPREIEQLVAAAGQLEPQDSLRPRTYQTLFCLLASTGLRIREALALRRADVTPDGLVVQQTKFRKSRLVPLHDTAQVGLESYLQQRFALPIEDDHLFVNRHARPLHYRSVEKVFRPLAEQLGLRSKTTSPRPHLHSFRHTFAVRALERCPHERDAVGRHLLALSTYLGHASVSDTYWYLEATPELLTDISRACETFLAEVTR